MNVEKIIRVLGYVVYFALWSPVIVLFLTILPMVWMLMNIRAGRSAKESFDTYKNALVAGVQHDVDFIKTGKW